MRYRIQTIEGRAWDTKQKRSNTVTSGEYNSYKSFRRALSVANKADIKWRYDFVIVEDIAFKGYKTVEDAALSK